MAEKRKRGRPSEGRSKRGYRLRPEAVEALGWLEGYGMDTETAALELAVCVARNALAEASAQVAGMFSREEWNYLADVMNAPLLDGYLTRGSPAHALALEAHDGHALNGTGTTWFGPKKAGERVKGLVKKLAGLTTVQAWAVLLAVHRFWRHQDIDHAKDEWWAAGFRREGVDDAG